MTRYFVHCGGIVSRRTSPSISRSLNMSRIEFLSQSELDDLVRELQAGYRFRRRRLLVACALQFDRHDILGSIKLCNGKRYAIYCICPFHNESTGSFRLLPDGSARCFGCGYRANIVELIYKIWRPHDLDDLMALIRDFSRARHIDHPDQLLLDFSASSR